MSSGKWRPFCLGLNVLKVYRVSDNYNHIMNTSFSTREIYISMPQSLRTQNHVHYYHGTAAELGVQPQPCTVYPKKYAHGFAVLCFVVVMQSFIMN